jgi:hypothetical protein
MASWYRVGELSSWISFLAEVLDKRNRWRQAPMLLGALWATGRRTVSRWITAAALTYDWQRFCVFLWSAGRKADLISRPLLRLAMSIIPAEDLGELICLAIDDTPTARCGPKVVGADIHRDPTPGPSGNPYYTPNVLQLPGSAPQREKSPRSPGTCRNCSPDLAAMAESAELVAPHFNRGKKETVSAM